MNKTYFVFQDNKDTKQLFKLLTPPYVKVRTWKREKLQKQINIKNKQFKL